MLQLFFLIKARKCKARWRNEIRQWNDSLRVNTVYNVAWSSTESVSFRIIIRDSLAFSRSNWTHSRKQNNTGISTTWQRWAYLSEAHRSTSRLYEPTTSSNDSANRDPRTLCCDIWSALEAGLCVWGKMLKTDGLFICKLIGRRPPLVPWWNWEGILRSHIQHSFSPL